MSDTAVLLPWVPLQFCDPAGVPLAFGKVYAYEAGTDDPKDTYTDEQKGGTNTNPVILDAYGSASIWLDGIYKIIVTDLNDVPVWQRDYVSAVDLNTLATEDSVGLVQLATDAETLAGLLKTKATHPHGVNYATKVFNQTEKTDFVAADNLLLGDSVDDDLNKRITALNFETQLKADLEDWVNGLIADAGGGGGTAPTVLTGTIVDAKYAAYTSSGAISSFIPDDNTKPQITEGTEILTATITPKKTTNKLRITANIANPRGNRLTGAVFNGAADAIVCNSNGSTNESFIIGPYEYVPGALTPVVVSVRTGISGNSASSYNLNMTATGKTLGGVMGCFLIVEEIDPTAGSGGTSSYVLLGSGTVDTSASSGLIDLRTPVSNDTYKRIVIEVDEIVTTGASGGAGVLNILFAQQGAANSASNYNISSGGSWNEFTGNFNQAPQRILHTPGGSVDLTDGSGTIELYNFCTTTRKPPWINSTIITYKSNASIASQVAYGNTSQIWGSGGDDTKITDGIAFSVTNVTKYTFNYKIYGII